jgi:hydrogenase-4 component E
MTAMLFSQLSTLSASLVLIMGIGVLWRTSLPAYIEAFALQSFFLMLCILTVAIYSQDWELYLVAILLCALKVVFIPKVLHRARRYVGADIEIRPFINIPMSVLLAGVLTLFAYAVSEPVVALTDLPTRSSIPLALAVVFVGLFIIVSRRSALTQIVGFLVMENGIALLAALATFGIPLIVELGVFLDLFLGFLVMQVFLYRIRETFATIDVDQLRNLKH